MYITCDKRFFCPDRKKADPKIANQTMDVVSDIYIYIYKLTAETTILQYRIPITA